MKNVLPDLFNEICLYVQYTDLIYWCHRNVTRDTRYVTHVAARGDDATVSLPRRKNREWKPHRCHPLEVAERATKHNDLELGAERLPCREPRRISLTATIATFRFWLTGIYRVATLVRNVEHDSRMSSALKQYSNSPICEIKALWRILKIMRSNVKDELFREGQRGKKHVTAKK